MGIKRRKISKTLQTLSAMAVGSRRSILASGQFYRETINSKCEIDLGLKGLT
jgi:hypothetical protein